MIAASGNGSASLDVLTAFIELAKDPAKYAAANDALIASKAAADLATNNAGDRITAAQAAEAKASAVIDTASASVADLNARIAATKAANDAAAAVQANRSIALDAREALLKKRESDLDVANAALSTKATQHVIRATELANAEKALEAARQKVIDGQTGLDLLVAENQANAAKLRAGLAAIDAVAGA